MISHLIVYSTKYKPPGFLLSGGENGHRESNPDLHAKEEQEAEQIKKINMEPDPEQGPG